MTRVLANELYEWGLHEQEPTCEDCGEVMHYYPDDDSPGEPHWRREGHFDPCGDVFEALCDGCYANSVSEILSDGGR